MKDLWKKVRDAAQRLLRDKCQGSVLDVVCQGEILDALCQGQVLDVVCQGEILQDESGQAYVEVLALVPVFLVLIVGAAYFGRAWYAKVAAEVAAYDGTRTAIEAMNEENPHSYMPGGRFQGIIAARRTLAGFYLDPSAADVRVAPVGVWDRGEAVRCDVRYSVDLSGVPGIGLINADPVLPVWARTFGQVEAYKSEW